MTSSHVFALECAFHCPRRWGHLMKFLFWSIAIVIGIATAAQAQDPQAILN